MCCFHFIFFVFFCGMATTKEKKDIIEGNIQTFLRIRPSKKPSGYFVQDDLDPETLTVNLPENYRSQSQEYINNSKLHHRYHFNGILSMDYTQEQTFKKVGVAAVQNALDGLVSSSSRSITPSSSSSSSSI